MSSDTHVHQFLDAAAIGMAGFADTALTIVLVIAVRRSRKGRPRYVGGSSCGSVLQAALTDGENRPESESWIDVLQLYLINTGASL